MAETDDIPANGGENPPKGPEQVASTKGGIPELPRGMYPGRIDEKGRMKLPAVFQQYFTDLTEKKLFVTSVDRNTAQIYPISAWRENEKLFDTYFEDPDTAERVAFTAAELGNETEMDGQGRVSFSSDLRRELGIEGQQVRMYAYRGHIEVLSDKLYNELRGQSSENPRANAKKMQRAGMK